MKQPKLLYYVLLFILINGFFISLELLLWAETLPPKTPAIPMYCIHENKWR